MDRRWTDFYSRSERECDRSFFCVNFKKFVAVLLCLLVFELTSMRATAGVNVVDNSGKSKQKANRLPSSGSKSPGGRNIVKFRKNFRSEITEGVEVRLPHPKKSDTE